MVIFSLSKSDRKPSSISKFSFCLNMDFSAQSKLTKVLSFFMQIHPISFLSPLRAKSQSAIRSFDYTTFSKKRQAFFLFFWGGHNLRRRLIICTAHVNGLYHAAYNSMPAFMISSMNGVSFSLNSFVFIGCGSILSSPQYF